MDYTGVLVKGYGTLILAGPGTLTIAYNIYVQDNGVVYCNTNLVIAQVVDTQFALYAIHNASIEYVNSNIVTGISRRFMYAPFMCNNANFALNNVNFYTGSQGYFTPFSAGSAKVSINACVGSLIECTMGDVAAVTSINSSKLSIGLYAYVAGTMTISNVPRSEERL